MINPENEQQKMQDGQFFIMPSHDDLAEWAGSTVYLRGRTYHSEGRIRDLVRTSAGGLLATVDGSRRYVTYVFYDEDGELASSCTCPYGAQCKHVVALVCAYMAMVDDKIDVPIVSANDRRLIGLDIDDNSDEAGMSGHNLSFDELEAELQRLSKEQLIALLLKAVRLAPEVASLCVSRVDTKHKKNNPLLKDAREAMHEALEVPDWDSYYGREADYGPVCKKLEVLLLAGFPEEVIELGHELIEECTEQLETCNDEGDTQYGVAQCMEVVLRALREVEWPLHKKLIWVAEAVLMDDFGVCDCFKELLREKHPVEDWNIVADALLERVEQDDDTGYMRCPLIDMAINALGEAGRDDEIISLSKNEAVQTGDYRRVVKILIEKGTDEDAEEWINKGLVVAAEDTYILASLRSSLITLRKKQNNWDAALCMQVENFARHPSFELFKECEESAEKINVWPVMRSLLMGFVIENKFPWEHGSWPLQARGTVQLSRERKHPDYDVLIDIAVDDNNPEEVLKWYDMRCELKQGFPYDADKIAMFVQDFSPSRAIELWKSLVESYIALTKPSAYEDAAVYLCKIGKFMSKLNLVEEWKTYIQTLRVEHRRKSRLIKTLNNLPPIH